MNELIEKRIDFKNNKNESNSTLDNTDNVHVDSDIDENGVNDYDIEEKTYQNYIESDEENNNNNSDDRLEMKQEYENEYEDDVSLNGDVNENYDMNEMNKKTERTKFNSTNDEVYEDEYEQNSSGEGDDYHEEGEFNDEKNNTVSNDITPSQMMFFQAK